MGLILEARGPVFFLSLISHGLSPGFAEFLGSCHGTREFETVGVAWSNKPGCKARLHDEIPV